MKVKDLFFNIKEAIIFIVSFPVWIVQVYYMIWYYRFKKYSALDDVDDIWYLADERAKSDGTYSEEYTKAIQAAFNVKYNTNYKLCNPWNIMRHFIYNIERKDDISKSKRRDVFYGLLNELSPDCLKKEIFILPKGVL